MVFKNEFPILSSFCRLCATSSELLIPVFDKEGEKERIGWKIRKCLPILVQEDDGKPKQVCLSCITKLDVCYELVELCLAADAKFESFLQSNPIGTVVTSNGESLQEAQNVQDGLESRSESGEIFVDVAAVAPQQEDGGDPESDAGVDGERQMERNQTLTWPVEVPTAPAGFYRQDGGPLALSPEGSVIVLGKMQQDGSVSAFVPREDCQDFLLMMELKFSKEPVASDQQTQSQAALPQVQQQHIKARILNYVSDSLNVERGKALQTSGVTEAEDVAYVTEGDAEGTCIAYTASEQVPISKAVTLSYAEALSADSHPVSFADTNVTSSFMTATEVVADTPIYEQSTVHSPIIDFAEGSPIEAYPDDCPTPKMEFVDTSSAVDPQMADLVYESDGVSETTDIKPSIDDSQKPFECTECGKRFMRRTNLRSHLATHTLEKPHVCKTCGKSFAVRWDLTLHARLHTGVFTCEVCGKAFSVRGKLERHRRVHSGERPFLCNECGKAFSDKHNLEAHVRTHSDQRPYSCSQCGNTFRSRSHLRAHRRVHSQDAPFVCHLCGKSFKWKANLNLHIKVHSGERVKCDCCDKEFARPADLVRHRRCHDGVRPHNCTVCSKTYTDRAALNKHMKVHAEHRPFVCDICHKGFHFKWYLNSHKKNHEAQETKKYICNTCGKEFPRKISLVGHERFHASEALKEAASSPASVATSQSSQPPSFLSNDHLEGQAS